MVEISVIVPVYKAERYLKDCVDSILNQTFSDLEILLVDDGSPDGCGAICDDYAAREPRVTAIHQENQGQSAARNHAMKYAKGNWICFVDSDDLIHPQMISALYEAVRESGAGISMCQMLEARSLPEDFMNPREIGFKVFSIDESTLVSLFDKKEYPAWVSCAKLIRRDLVESYPFQPGRIYEDNEAVCRWVVKGKILAKSQEALYFYRTNPISTTQSAFSLKKLDYLWALESIIRFYHGLGYRTLTQRFCDMYASAASVDYYHVCYELQQRDIARGIYRNIRKLFLWDRIPITKPQFETLLGVLHPNLIRLYWPVVASIQIIKKDGIVHWIKKVCSQLQKGAEQ